MLQRIGPNIDAQAVGDSGKLFAWSRKAKPATVLVMNDDPAKMEICDGIHAASPETLIVHRAHNPHEGRLHDVSQDDGTIVSPQEYLNYLKGWNRDYIIHNVGNEPTNIDDLLRKELLWYIDLMKLAREQGLTLCVLNRQFVVDHPDVFDSGLYDNFLRAVGRYGHYLGVHEYALGILPANISEERINLLSQPGKFPLSEWANLARERELFTRTPKEAHLGRYQLLIKRAKLIGAYPIKVIITEFGWDDVQIGYYDQIRGLNKGIRPLGVPTLTNLWREHYPELTPVAAAFIQLEWANKVYPQEVIGLCVFAWNATNPEWSGFDVSAQDDLLGLWAELYAPVFPPPVATLPPVIPDVPVPPTPPAQSTKIIVTGKVYLRAQPNAAGLVLGILAVNMLGTTQALPADVGKRDYILVEFATVIGYIYGTFVKVI